VSERYHWSTFTCWPPTNCFRRVHPFRRAQRRICCLCCTCHQHVVSCRRHVFDVANFSRHVLCLPTFIEHVTPSHVSRHSLSANSATTPAPPISQKWDFPPQHSPPCLIPSIASLVNVSFLLLLNTAFTTTLPQLRDIATCLVFWALSTGVTSHMLRSDI
jgi:hypothetical protein